mgnify:CR=1 FL=1
MVIEGDSMDYVASNARLRSGNTEISGRLALAIIASNKRSAQPRSIVDPPSRSGPGSPSAWREAV